MKVNLNDLAKDVCAIEGGKVNLNIAEVKQVLKCLGSVLTEKGTEYALAVLQKLIGAK